LELYLTDYVYLILLDAPTSKSVTKKPKSDSVGSQSKKKGAHQTQKDENSTLDSLSKDSLAKSLQNKLNVSSSSIASTTSASSKKKSKIDVAQEYKKRSSEQESLNLIIVGHVDAGKSTMMGHLLVQLGEINSRTISKFKRVGYFK
jgi:elongation factor 1 alpha-like protein